MVVEEEDGCAVLVLVLACGEERVRHAVSAFAALGFGLWGLGMDDGLYGAGGQHTAHTVSEWGRQTHETGGDASIMFHACSMGLLLRPALQAAGRQHGRVQQSSPGGR